MAQPGFANYGMSMPTSPGVAVPKKGMDLKTIVTISLVVLGLVALYYFYNFLYSADQVAKVTLINGQIKATEPVPKLPSMPAIYEGGEYSVSTWVYIASYNTNRNRRKHILEIGGNAFKTLLIGLGAFKNTLVVRTHSKDPLASGVTGAEAFQSGSAGSSSSSGNSTASNTSNAATTGTGSSSNTSTSTTSSGSNSSSSSASTSSTSSSSSSTSSGSSAAPTTTETPGSQRTDGTLTAADMTALFQPMAMDDVLLNSNAICDLPEIDMQRWALVTVVLNGRTVDVYLDGKLARSCITKSYYKVDPTGVSVKLLDKGGFDGYLANVNLFNYALNPDEVYRMYASGPGSTATDVLSWIGNLFRGSAPAQ